MEDPVLHDLVAMGKFFGSLDRIGVTPAKGGKGTTSLRLAVTSAPKPSIEFRPASGPVMAQPPRTEPAGAAAGPVPARLPAVPRDLSVSTKNLQSIRDEIGDCKRCRLCEGRNKIVFGQGSAIADLMFVGEAPGADEDASGLAFVGRAGQLLTDMIEKGMKIKRDDVFIANVIKCRPPGNRPPESDEVLTCQPFLEQQIKVVQPRAIVALGATAGKFMARTGDPISKIRGRWHSWDGIPVMPTYHPAYLLRNPDAKKTVWADLKLVMDVLGLNAE